MKEESRPEGAAFGRGETSLARVPDVIVLAWELGYLYARAEMADRWDAIAAPVGTAARSRHLTYRALAKARQEPSGAAYEAAQQRRGGVEYIGGPVSWEAP